MGSTAAPARKGGKTKFRLSRSSTLALAPRDRQICHPSRGNFIFTFHSFLCASGEIHVHRSAYAHVCACADTVTGVHRHMCMY